MYPYCSVTRRLVSAVSWCKSALFSRLINSKCHIITVLLTKPDDEATSGSSANQPFANDWNARQCRIPEQCETSAELVSEVMFGKRPYT